MPTKSKQTKTDEFKLEVYDRLPYGVVVADNEGELVGANAAAVRLLWDDEKGPPTRCHEMLGCRKPGGPCEERCLVERAAAAEEPLPEIRIDTRPGASVTAVWVTAASMDSGTRALMHLRPGDARDRRRRTDPHWLQGPELTIRALGRTRVDSREGPMGGVWLQQRPGQVLKYLICERNRVVHAEEMAEALWPGSRRQGINNVRHFIHQLRAKLEPDRPKSTESSFIVTVRGGYAINRRRVRIDADEFEELVDTALEAAGSSDHDTASERLETGLALYRGDLVADEPYSEWAYAERDRLRALAAKALKAAAGIRLGRGELGPAAGHLDRLTELEPYDVDVHRELFSVWLAQGRRTKAARRYEAFRARMRRDFDDDPGFTLADVRPVSQS